MPAAEPRDENMHTFSTADLVHGRDSLGETIQRTKLLLENIVEANEAILTVPEGMDKNSLRSEDVEALMKINTNGLHLDDVESFLRLRVRLWKEDRGANEVYIMKKMRETEGVHRFLEMGYLIPVVRYFLREARESHTEVKFESPEVTSRMLRNAAVLMKEFKNRDNPTLEDLELK